jgi:DNA repair exonuclease SbcCD nuclease subunit
MKAYNKSKPNAIFTSDWHLREDIPTCRDDEFWNDQWKKVEFIFNLQQEYDCPVIHAGDLFHHWKPSPYLISKAIINLPYEFHTIYGQHDLPQHSLELRHKSGVHALECANALRILPHAHFGEEPKESSIKIQGRSILVWHQLVWKGKRPWPNCTDPSGEDVLNKYPQFDVILTGDNHKTFFIERENQLLVNPGSLMRQSADQIEHRPCVFLWYARPNVVNPVYLPIRKDAVSRSHIEAIKDRDERIAAFISKLSGEWDVTTSFEENLEHFTKENNIRRSVKNIIRKALETEP